MHELSIDEQIERVLSGINALPEQVSQATMFALNRVAEWMKGRVSKEVCAEHRMKLKLIRDRIRIARANKRNLSSLLNCDFKGILARDLGIPHQTPAGTMVGNRLFRGAFVAILREGGRQGIYRRTTKKRFPVRSERVEIFDGARKIIEALVDTEAAEVFGTRFLHEIQRITGALA